MPALGDRGAKLQILNDFGEDKPHFADYDRWAEIEADKLGVPESAVRRVLGDYLDRQEALLAENMQTSSQRIADILGATKAAALRTCKEGLEATKPYTTHKLEIIAGELREVSVDIDIPDWRARHPFALAILNVHGSMAPIKFDANVSKEDKLTDAELNHRIIELARQQTGELGVGYSLAGEDSAAGDSGPLLLADRSHENEGRTGRAESIQAVPKKAVPPPSLKPVVRSQRGAGKRVQKPHHDAVVVGKRTRNTSSLHSSRDKDSVPERRRRKISP